MKAPIFFKLSSRRRGYATIAVVCALATVLLAMSAFTIRGNMTSFSSQARAQVKQDYTQKEDAILNSLLHIVPNKAIGAMQENSASNANDYTWNTIFSEALTMANAEQAASADLLTSLNLSSAISANTGDGTFESSSDFVAAPVKTAEGDSNLVNGGNWWEYYMLSDSKIGPNVPAPLRTYSYNDYLLDKQYPLITERKKYVDWYQKGLYLSPNNYPDFNLIQYPDVKFGYKRPGELFVAKRNWWVFSLVFGKHNEDVTGIPAVEKNYVLSIYEIPSQLPLTASSLMQVGQFSDGSDWENISLDGGIYADILQTQGTVAVSQGSLSARKSMNVGGTTTVEGTAISSDFDDIGKREDRALTSDGSDYYDASVGGNVGKVAFIPLNPGNDFLKRSSDGSSSSRISPTGWKTYTRGANRTAMRIDILEMAATDTQLPTKIKFYYHDTDNNWQSVTYTRGDNWPTEAESGGEDFPFQSDVLENLRNALIVKLDKLPTFLTGLSGAADITVNNSIYISPRESEPTVQAPSIPSLDSDMAVTLRGGEDLSNYTSGFSVVTDVRLYIGDSLNTVAITPPANSGLSASDEYYPPLSLFAPEKRFGESLTVEKAIDLRGQISTLKNTTGDTFNPLDLKGADDARVESHKLSAELVSLKSPAELPPIYLMNWMVTIEEVQ